MDAVILTVGDELLIGQVIDSNSAWIAKQLEYYNIKVKEIRSISDQHELIVKHLTDLFQDADLIIMTGGLGPTKDDVTKNAIADYLGVQLEFRDELFEQLRLLFSQINRTIKEVHKSQCFVPEGTVVIRNKMGTAQGMWLEKENKYILSMPGVPYEMKYIMENGGLDKIRALNPDSYIFHKTILTAGKGETDIEAELKNIIDSSPDHIKFAFLPSLGKVRIRISSRSKNGSEAELEEISQKIESKLGNLIFGYGEETLQSVIGKLLLKKNWTVGTAESCTGGLLSHTITSISGSSRYYSGSIIAYSNELKMTTLNVQEDTLIKYGAVSEATVIEMVAGAIENLGVDVAVSTSGIAGPTGGTADKPVGTIWIGCGSKDKVLTHKLQLSKNRLMNIEYTVIAALNLLRKFLTAQ